MYWMQGTNTQWARYPCPHRGTCPFRYYAIHSCTIRGFTGVSAGCIAPDCFAAPCVWPHRGPDTHRSAATSISPANFMAQLNSMFTMSRQKAPKTRIVIRLKGALAAMDTLRGNFDSNHLEDDQLDGLRDWDIAEEDSAPEPPPAVIGTDERRMQVRAYNHWASLLNDRNFPSIEELEPEKLPDFGPYSVLLDFTGGMENPAVQYLGNKLGAECGTHDGIDTLSDIPSRSLLSRITDHYMQILANQAPIGFEAEFVNQRGATILYRGILLPFSSDDEGIDFIYGVINWKEMADQQTADELMLEIDQALEQPEEESPARSPDPVTDWADGPASDVLDLGLNSEEPAAPNSEFPEPEFGSLRPSIAEETESPVAAQFGLAEDYEEAISAAIAAPKDENEGLYDCLAAARELAHTARNCEDRTRSALYAAVGRAYDFSIAAHGAQEEFDDLVAENGLTVQDRAPMTPVVKLVFGGDYDKTRLTEYAAVLTHAHRIGVERGALANFLSQAEGGLKGVVHAERRLRREESGKEVEDASRPSEKLARKLRALKTNGFDAIEADGAEFGLVMIRRLATGEVVMLGEVADDIALVERAARKLLG